MEAEIRIFSRAGLGAEAKQMAVGRRGEETVRGAGYGAGSEPSRPFASICKKSNCKQKSPRIIPKCIYLQLYKQYIIIFFLPKKM